MLKKSIAGLVAALAVVVCFTVVSGDALVAVGGLLLVTPAGGASATTNVVTIANPGTLSSTVGRQVTIIVTASATNLLKTSGSNITGTDPLLGVNDTVTLTAISATQWLITDARDN